ncbi:hypothetical protein [Jeongeupia sp. USM3]|uniref:hypothetical protein n=1 Tax=Jeongeupia sp. USM3 TaxID=1906741 RepID=UPI00089DED77|nr:hypothetical protein [Jeongeupia sp. USM3]AOY01667.1 hypothetical protein BJP62_15105 [Jeongeupia sp. USM3]
MGVIRALLWASLVLVFVALALLAGVFFGKRLADTDAAAQDARIAALGRELSQSRGEVHRLRDELTAMASRAAAEASAASTVVAADAVQAAPAVAPVREPAYRRFGNTSCTLSVGGGGVDDDCVELRRISASQPSGR